MDKNLLPHVSGGWKSKMKVSAELISSQDCEEESVLRLLPSFRGFCWPSSGLLSVWEHRINLCFYVVISGCVCVFKIPRFIRISVILDVGPW